ncbi:hypothetical protein GGF46_002175, partial [Coemansia sp. RSA 552]
CAGNESSSDAMVQSMGDLSVVSLPDESAYDIAENRGPRTDLEWACRVQAMTMLLLHVAITESHDISWASVSSEEKVAADQVIPQIAWQVCHSKMPRQGSTSEPIDCMVVLGEISANGDSGAAGFAVSLAVTVLRWLLVCAYRSDVATGGMDGGMEARAAAWRSWSTFVRQWIVPDDISTVPTIQRHSELLSSYRCCLTEAVLTIGDQKSCADINTAIVQDHMLDDLLVLVQLAATITPGPAPESDSSFEDLGDNGAGEHLGTLVCETLRLLAFLIHGSEEHTARFSSMEGYRIVHECAMSVVDRSPDACGPIFEGVLALLSGVMDSAKCRAWRGLEIDRHWLLTAVSLYSRLPLAACAPALRFIAHWCEEDRRARWWWSQSTIARQAIERLQALFPELALAFVQVAKRRNYVAAFLRYLEGMLAAVVSMSTCAADLKLILQTLVPGGSGGSAGDPVVKLEESEVADYTAAVRRTMSSVLFKCARSEAGQSYFDFDGRPAALHMPHFRRIPEQGFTFAAWICPDLDAQQRPEHQHLLAAKSYTALSSAASPGSLSQRHSTVALPLLFAGKDEASGALSTVLHLVASGKNEVVVAHSRATQGLELHVTADDTPHRVKCAAGIIDSKRWHSLTICYAPAKRGWSPFGTSNLHIYVDGAQVYKGSLPYVDYSTYRECYIGGSPAAESRGITSSFSGRISGVRMFDGLLRTSEIELLHCLGPALSSQLHKQQASDPTVASSALSQTSDQSLPASFSPSLPRDVARLFLSGELGSRLILCLDADTASESSCMDLSPIGICQSIVRENLRYGSSPHDGDSSRSEIIPLCPQRGDADGSAGPEDRVRAERASRRWQICGTVLAMHTRRIHQLMGCLGGIESIFILVYRLDWIGPAVPAVKEGPLGSEESIFDQRVLERLPLPSFFYLLRDLVRGNPQLLASVLSFNAVPLIARIVQQQRDLAPHLNIAALRAAQAFQVVLDAQGGLLPSVYSETSQLWCQVQREIVFNLRIWRRAEVGAQLQYLREMLHQLCLGRVGDEQGKRCNAAAGVCGKSAGDGGLGIRWILYALFNYYPYDASQHISKQQHQQQQLGRARLRARSLSTRPSTSSSPDNGLATGRSTTEPPRSSTAIAGSGSMAVGDEYAVDFECTGGSVPGFPLLSRDETRQLRRVLLRALELFLTASEEQGTRSPSGGQIPAATKTDILHLVRHLLYSCNRDIEHTREVLQLLFRCLADGSANATNLASQILGMHGLDVLTHLIECDEDKMAAEAINIVALLLTMSNAARGSESTASRITSSLRGRASVVVDEEHIARVLALVRTKRALTPALCRALLSLTMRDQATLLASINIDSAPAGPAGAHAPKQSRHIRNLSVPQSNSSSVYLVEEALTDSKESFVAPLPSRLIQDANAWAAILELSCASGSDPAIRIVVLRDLCQLCHDEPANIDRLDAAHFPLLGQLFVIATLGGHLSEECADRSDSTKHTSARLSETLVKAMEHLELVPHTTLDHRMQTLAAEHIKARKAWVQRRVRQLHSSVSEASTVDGDDEEMLVKAQTELMDLTLEWSQAATDLIQILVKSFFPRMPDYADKVHRNIVSLWALTPTGSVPLAVRLLTLVLAQARDMLASDPKQGPAGDWVLGQNLQQFATHALDVLFNYRQFQEYVAYHHEYLKALSVSTAAAAAAAAASPDERETVYHSQHSPWDDMAGLARDLVEFMLELDSARSSPPMCTHILRLAVSGIRSMDLQRVEESLHYLIQLLERHPFLADDSLGSPPEAFGRVCTGSCAIAQRSFAVLGYVHEAFMFADEQASSSTVQPAKSDGDVDGDTASAGSLACDSISRQYMVVLQCYRAYLCTACPKLSARFKAPDGRILLDWEQFTRLVRSTEWQDLYRMQFMPAMRSMEEEEMAQTSASQADFAAMLRKALVRSQRSEARQTREIKDAQTSVASSTLPIEADETSLVKAEELGRSDGRWSQIWQQRLQSLSGPRGPWRSASRVSRPVQLAGQRWVLDMAENSQRMRRRLVKNTHYEDHQLAADRRDRIGQRGRGKGQEQSNKQDPFEDNDGDMPHLSLSVPGADGADGQGLDGEDGWSLVTPDDFGVVAASTEPGAAHFSISGERIALLGGVFGRIELTQSLLRFVVERDSSGQASFRGSDGSTRPVTGQAADEPSQAGKQPTNADGGPRAIHAELNRDVSWLLSDIVQVHFRRFMMRKSAIEVFFRDCTSLLLNIPNRKALMQLVWKLTSLAEVNRGLTLSEIRPPSSLLRRLQLTERWQHGELSNFDYLMALNTIAGRSYNDLSQYPVFPWVIQDYTSKWIDLRSPRTYRDLSRPIGALNEKRLQHFIERYESFEDPSGRIKKFLYGTHYSSAASVAYYLIRTEPFASVHISLQSGKFDHADRQFHSIGETWNSCMTGPGDVKELIPEFFYLPEFLTNHNGLDLGVKQNGTRLGDVKLPPWAATPEEFIRINRQALESEHVSANLHKWVDLVFGFKQRGPEAAKAHNVFYYLTYEGAVNIDAISDPMERASIESQIHYFGQTPTQLFTAPHPPRRAHLPSPPYCPLTTPAAQVQQFILQASSCDISFVGSPLRAAPAHPRARIPASVPWRVPYPQTRGALPRDGAKETITVVDSSGRISAFDITLSAGDQQQLRLSVSPIVEGYIALAAAYPPSRSQQLAHARERPVSYAVVPGMPELLVTCVHMDGAVRCSRIASAHDNVAGTGLSARGVGMTNAYASAVVSAMSSDNDGPADDYKRDKPDTLASIRPLASLFGGGSGGSSDRHRSGTRRRGTGSVSDSAEDAAAPSTYIPLAARLLEPINESSSVYVPGQATCVALSSNGQSAVVGTGQGTVAVLSVDFADAGSADSVASSLLGADSSLTSASAPLLFASGLVDPMSTSIGYTSMAAYTRDTASPVSADGRAGKWVLRHVLCSHDAAVLDVAVDTDHDLVASASSDGTIIMWGWRSGQYLRTLVPAYSEGPSSCDVAPPALRHHQRYSRVERVLISSEALVVCYSVSGTVRSDENCDRMDPVRALGQSAKTVYGYSAGEQKAGTAISPGTAECMAGTTEHIGEGGAEAAALHVYGINGRHLRTRKLVHPLRDIALTQDGRFGACVSLDSRVAVFDTYTLGVVRQFELPACGCSITWSGASEQQLIVGCEGGLVVVIAK